MVDEKILNGSDIVKKRRFLADAVPMLSPDILNCFLSILALKAVKFKGNVELKLSLSMKDGILTEQVKYERICGYINPQTKYCVSKDGEHGLKFEKMEN